LTAKGILEACARQYFLGGIKRIEEIQGWTHIISGREVLIVLASTCSEVKLTEIGVVVTGSDNK
jgi:hypothetical protein